MYKYKWHSLQYENTSFKREKFVMLNSEMSGLPQGEVIEVEIYESSLADPET